MPTKDELEAENADLRQQVEDLQSAQTAPAGTALNTAPPVPTRPDFGLSAGEANDLAVNGVATSPFTGETLIASVEGVTPQTPTAKANDKRARADRPAEHVTTDARPVAEAPAE